MDLSKLLGDLYEGDGPPADEADPAAGTADVGEGGTPDDAGNANASTDPSTDAIGDQSDAGQAEGGYDASAGPDWSDEVRLERAFADWTPGPPSGAPAAEREMAYAGATPSARSLQADPQALASPIAGDVGHLDGAHQEMAAEEAVVEPSEIRPWSRSDDDVLPRARRRRGAGRLSLRRR